MRDIKFPKLLGYLTRRTLLVAAVAGCAPIMARAVDSEPVRVGLLSSQSGVFAQQGEEVIRAVTFAVEEANAHGGVDGRKVEVRVADDEGTPDAGRKAAEKLARDGYNLLIGAIPSSISLALAPNLQRWNAMYFVVASKSDKITGDSCKSRMFRTNHSDAMDMAMISTWAKEFKETKYASIAADYVWGHDSSQSFAKAVESQGKKVALQLFAPLGTKDFSPYIAQLKDAKVDAIWVAETGRDAIAFVKQAQEFGLIPGTRLIGHSLIMNFMIDATGTALDGTQGTSGYTPDIDNARNKAFVGAWQAKFGRLPTDNEGQAYNGAQVMFEGVKRAHSVDPDKIAAALSGATLETIYGPATMRADDNQLVLPNFVARAKMADGKLRPVIEETFPPSLTPPPSTVCKLS